jgi:hypothetical protein
VILSTSWTSSGGAYPRPGASSPKPAGRSYSGAVEGRRFEAGRYRLWVLDVGLACCAVEFVAATLDPALEELGV